MNKADRVKAKDSGLHEVGHREHKIGLAHLEVQFDYDVRIEESAFSQRRGAVLSLGPRGARNKRTASWTLSCSRKAAARERRDLHMLLVESIED